MLRSPPVHQQYDMALKSPFEILVAALRPLTGQLRPNRADDLNSKTIQVMVKTYNKHVQTKPQLAWRTNAGTVARDSLSLNWIGGNVDRDLIKQIIEQGGDYYKGTSLLCQHKGIPNDDYYKNKVPRIGKTGDAEKRMGWTALKGVDSLNGILGNSSGATSSSSKGNGGGMNTTQANHMETGNGSASSNTGGRQRSITVGNGDHLAQVQDTQGPYAESVSLGSGHVKKRKMGLQGRSVN